MAVFVVQKHQATHLHYDFRLELDGVLKSWAILKEPPAKAGVKRLAVQVDDHDLSYASFERVIPEGQYGAGTVEIWDKGDFELVDRKKDKLIFKLSGKKLNGAFCLIRFKNGGKNWIFFKKRDG